MDHLYLLSYAFGPLSAFLRFYCRPPLFFITNDQVKAKITVCFPLLRLHSLPKAWNKQDFWLALEQSSCTIHLLLSDRPVCSTVPSSHPLCPLRFPTFLAHVESIRSRLVRGRENNPCQQRKRASRLGGGSRRVGRWDSPSGDSPRLWSGASWAIPTPWDSSRSAATRHLHLQRVFVSSLRASVNAPPLLFTNSQVRSSSPVYTDGRTKQDNSASCTPQFDCCPNTWSLKCVGSIHACTSGSPPVTGSLGLFYS